MGRLVSRHGRLLLVLVALVLVIAAADRSGLRWDFSADRRFTLVEALRERLRKQSGPIELVGIWSAEDLARYGIPAEDAELITEAAQRMRAENPRITWRRIDPELHRPLLADFVQRFREADHPALYVASGTRVFKIPVTYRLRYSLQQEVGGALDALALDRPPVVAVVKGHGELHPGGGNDDGADRVMRAWELFAGVRVVTRDLAGDRPHAGEVVALLGPTAPFDAAEIDVLRRHLDDGGAMLVLADDRLDPVLTAFLRSRGVLVGGLSEDQLQALTVDPLAVLSRPFTGQLLVIASHRGYEPVTGGAYSEPNLRCDGPLINPEHPLCAAVQRSNRAVLSPWSTPLAVLDPSAVEAPLAERLRNDLHLRTAVPLMRTAPKDAWLFSRAKTLEVPRDLSRQPPYDLLWAIDYSPTATSAQAGRGARLVVWGSRQAASDAVLEREHLANAMLLASAVRWLADLPPPADIPEAQTRPFRVECSEGALMWLVAALVALMPSCCIGAAILAWWERR